MFENITGIEYKEWRELLMIHKFAVDEMRTRLNNLDEEFQTIHDYNPIEHISYRVKTYDRITEKLQRLGLAPSVENAKKNIFDIAGIRIICAFTADIFDVFEMIKAQSDLEILEVKDYIDTPKENGYKSLHVHVEIPVYLSSGVIRTRIEIQLRTIAMDFWASVEHKLYYKYKGKSPDNIRAELKECADLISELDDRMYTLKKLILCLENDDSENCMGEAYISNYFKEG
jgi:putative GTP pyrophosphokinase